MCQFGPLASCVNASGTRSQIDDTWCSSGQLRMFHRNGRGHVQFEANFEFVRSLVLKERVFVIGFEQVVRFFWEWHALPLRGCRHRCLRA